MDARATYEYCASKGDFISLEGTGRFFLLQKKNSKFEFPTHNSKHYFWHLLLAMGTELKFVYSEKATQLCEIFTLLHYSTSQK